jgi:hypothetical protein
VKYKYVKSCVSTNYQVELNVDEVLPGTYILCVEALWNNCAKSPHSDFQQFCVKLLADDFIKLQETDHIPEFLEQSFASRALDNHAKSNMKLSINAQIMPYNSRPGAFKVVESTDN